MKTLVSVMAVMVLVTLLAFGVMAYAHSPGGWGGNMMGQGGHMMGQGGQAYGYDSKFLNETVDFRKELHNKKFEYFEAIRNQETTPETIAKLEKDIYKLQNELYEKSPRTAYGRHGGNGCW